MEKPRDILEGGMKDMYWKGYDRGFEAGQQSVPYDPCACKFHEDGETILKPCMAHKKWKESVLSVEEIVETLPEKHYFSITKKGHWMIREQAAFTTALSGLDLASLKKQIEGMKDESI